MVDLVYDPVATALIATAHEVGATTADGVGMLVHQAGHAFAAWTGERAPLDVMEQAARAATAPN